SHATSAPMMLAKNTTNSVEQPSAKLTISGNLSAAAGVVLSKAGPGTLEAPNYRVDQLAINEGLAKVTSNGSFSGTSRVKSLLLARSGSAWQSRLDLTNNHMVIDYSGASPLPTVADQIASGYNGGTWNGTGIISSSAPAGFNGHPTALGYAEA